eukprot:4990533-Prymnesium_polylepis.1
MCGSISSRWRQHLVQACLVLVEASLGTLWEVGPLQADSAPGPGGGALRRLVARFAHLRVSHEGRCQQAWHPGEHTVHRSGRALGARPARAEPVH